jgi:threonylcarbamoyladenosine tRNA methylthiotransferase MtaB
MAIDVLTFGCRLNTLESEVMRARAAKAGLDDAVLVNSCAVTGEAVRQARQAIRRARRDNPARRIIVTGCAAQTEPDTFAAMAEVDAVLGNAEKLTTDAYRALPDFGVSSSEKLRVNDIMSVTQTAPHMVDGIEGRTRAFVQVQNGCDHRCTFCIIPFGRGNSRSMPTGAVVEQVRRLVANGYREAVLTGVDITSWGADLPGAPRLGALVRAILRHVPDLARLRLSSIDSIEADDGLLRALAEEERLMPHLHLSLQAGDDMILKRMKRRHLRADAVDFCKKARRLRPDVVFGADIIAAFHWDKRASGNAGRRNRQDPRRACRKARLRPHRAFYSRYNRRRPARRHRAGAHCGKRRQGPGGRTAGAPTRRCGLSDGRNGRQDRRKGCKEKGIFRPADGRGRGWR